MTGLAHPVLSGSPRRPRFWLFWIRNTMRKVTMVVPVLMPSCHVSEHPNIGPVAAHTRTATRQTRKATGVPAACADAFAKRPNSGRFAARWCEMHGVDIRLGLRDAFGGHRPHYATHGAARGRAGNRTCSRRGKPASGDHGPNARNGKKAKSSEQTTRSAAHDGSTGARVARP